MGLAPRAAALAAHPGLGGRVEQRRMGLAPRAAALAAVIAVGSATACSGDDPVSDAPDPPPTTIGLNIPDDPSEGTLRMSGATYDLAAACYASDSGVRAVGLGGGSAPGEMIEVYVQTDADAPYLGIRLPDGALVEPALDETLDFDLEDDVIRASAVRLARDLDLETGQGTPAGFGDVEIRCSGYEEAAEPRG